MKFILMSMSYVNLTEVFISKSPYVLNDKNYRTFRMAPGMMIVKNNPNISQWSLESGYTSETNDNEYPIRLSNHGQFSGLFKYLFIFPKNLEYICQMSGLGFSGVHLENRWEYRDHRFVYHCSKIIRFQLSPK